MWKVELLAQWGGEDKQHQNHCVEQIDLVESLALAPDEPNDQWQWIERDNIPIPMGAEES